MQQQQQYELTIQVCSEFVSTWRAKGDHAKKEQLSKGWSENSRRNALQ